MAPDIRSAERDLRNIDTLEQRGVTGAGSRRRQPRLDKVIMRHNEDTATFRALEQRVTTLLEREWTPSRGSLWNGVKPRENADRMKMGLTH
jgi:hypothetical protein